MQGLSDDHMLSVRTGADVLDFQPVAEERLDELNILLRVLWQLLPLRGAARAALPAGQRLIHDLDFLEDLQTSREGRQRLALVLVRDGDLELVKVVEHVQLRQVQRRVVVDLVRVGHHNSVEPACATLTARRHAPLAPHVLQLLADRVELLRREGTAAHARRVRLHDADYVAERAPAECQARQDAAEAGVGGGDVGIGAVIDVEHDGVGALDEDLGAGVLDGLQERDLVDDKGGHDLAVGLEGLDFGLDVVLEQVTVALLKAIGEAADLGLKERGVEDIGDTNTTAGHLCAVCWSNTCDGLILG